MAAKIPPGADLSKIPVAQSPDGHPPNFINPTSLGPATTGISVTFIIITLVLVGLRLTNQIRKKARLYAADWFCFVGWISSLGYTALVLSMTDLSRHAWDTPVSFFDVRFTKSSVALGFIYAPAAWFSKAAIFLMYIHLFRPVKWLRYCSYFGMVIMLAVNCVMIPVFAVYCVPRSGEAWDLSLLVRCKTSAIPALVQGAFGLASDMYLIALPLPIILSLSLPTGRKIGVAAVFLAGIFGVISSAIGIYYRYINKSGADVTWTAFATYICVIIELYITIIVSCAPAISSFWKTTVVDSKVFISLRSLLAPSSSSLSKTSRASQKHLPVHVAESEFELPENMKQQIAIHTAKDVSDDNSGTTKSLTVEHSRR